MRTVAAPAEAALFWHGLLTSGVMEVRDIEMMTQQNDLFHHHALGNYKELIHAIIRDPAMLRYLNNDQNVKGKPNENLARELLQKDHEVTLIESERRRYLVVEQEL